MPPVASTRRGWFGSFGEGGSASIRVRCVRREEEQGIRSVHRQDEAIPGRERVDPNEARTVVGSHGRVKERAVRTECALGLDRGAVHAQEVRLADDPRLECQAKLRAALRDERERILVEGLHGEGGVRAARLDGDGALGSSGRVRAAPRIALRGVRRCRPRREGEGSQGERRARVVRPVEDVAAPVGDAGISFAQERPARDIAVEEGLVRAARDPGASRPLPASSSSGACLGSANPDRRETRTATRMATVLTECLLDGHAIGWGKEGRLSLRVRLQPVTGGAGASTPTPKR